MAFWGSITSEPRRNFKFLVDLGGGEEFIPAYTVRAVNLPEVSIGEAEVNYLNHTFYYPGRVTYNEITVQLIDAIQEEISGQILQRISQAGYQIPTAQSAADTSLTPKADFGLGNVKLIQLGAGRDGDEKRATFSLRNTWIKQVQFDQGLEYSSENVSGISLVLRYDFFQFGTRGGTVGAGGSPAGFRSTDS